MPPPTAQQIFDWVVSEIDVQAPSREIRDWITDGLGRLDEGLGELEMSVLARECIDVVRAMLVREHARAVSEGMPVFEVVGIQDEFLRGYGLAQPDDDPDLAQRRQLAILREPVRVALRELSPIRFEMLWRLIIEHLGGSQFRHLGKSDDEGIDFTAEFNVYRLNAALGHVAPEWLSKTLSRSTITVIGQAKHWWNRTVQPAQFRELLGAVALHMPKLEKGERKGVTGMLVTTGRFSRNADRQARRSGLILLDGEWVISAIVNFEIGIYREAGLVLFDRNHLEGMIDQALGVNAT